MVGGIPLLPPSPLSAVVTPSAAGAASLIAISATFTSTVVTCASGISAKERAKFMSSFRKSDIWERSSGGAKKTGEA